MDSSLPAGVNGLFWDIDPRTLDLRRNARFIIGRVLDYGDAAAVNWLRRNYSEDEIRSVVAQARGLAHKTLAYWNRHFAGATGHVR
jgi:hypothetical protein